jgi:hypothetical protein
VDAQRIYDTLFPYYVEVATVTQYHKRGDKPGGWGGHATMFVNGAERDPAAGYPRLRLVPEGGDRNALDSGIGVSVNRIFKNVNWVAIPGRDLFLHGGVATDAELDEAAYEAAISRAANAGWFAGIQVEDALTRSRPSGMPAEEFIVRHSIGTDFALTFARRVYSVRLPLRRAAIGAVLDHLNSVNDAARSSGYTWNAYTNNCSHVIHNALAAAGVWDAKHVRGPGIGNLAKDLASVAASVVRGGISDFSFPANNFVRAYEAGNERPIDDVRVAFDDHDIARTLPEGWITTAPGALVVRYPIHDGARNRLFEVGRDPFLFSVPALWDKREKFLKLTRDPALEITDLGANLSWLRERYAGGLGSANAASDGDPAKPGFGKFRERFRALVKRALQETDDQLSRYEQLRAPV